jgi:type IV pilus assembly protein PilE
MSKQAGFTLIELLIAMVVVAILAAVALPAYNNYVTRGKIPDATSNLAAKRVKMEQYFQDNRTYLPVAPATNAGDLDTTTSKYFDFSAAPAGVGETRSTSTYTLYAIGKNSMTGFQFSVDQSNNKSSTVTGVSGWTGNSTCWVTHPGGQC